MATSTFLACGLLLQVGVPAQYSAAEKTRACVGTRCSKAEAPQVPGQAGKILPEVFSWLSSHSKYNTQLFKQQR